MKRAFLLYLILLLHIFAPANAGLGPSEVLVVYDASGPLSAASTAMDTTAPSSTQFSHPPLIYVIMPANS